MGGAGEAHGVVMECQTPVTFFRQFLFSFVIFNFLLVRLL
jgi:hypothetical protein